VLFDPDLFHAGEVWEWRGTLYLLLRFERERYLMYTTIKNENQQSWFALDLESGKTHEVRMHTGERGDRWKRIT